MHILAHMDPFFLTPLDRLPAAIAGPAIICAIAGVGTWYSKRTVVELSQRAGPHIRKTGDQLTALDPANQQKVELLAAAAAEISSENASQDLSDVEDSIDRRRKRAEIYADAASTLRWYRDLAD
jgi:hypothetical protein